MPLGIIPVSAEICHSIRLCGGRSCADNARGMSPSGFPFPAAAGNGYGNYRCCALPCPPERQRAGWVNTENLFIREYNTMATYSRSEKFAEAALRPVGGTKQHIRTNIITPVSRSSGERESRGISPSCAVCVSPPATQEDFNAREYIFAMIQYLNCSIYLFDFQVAEHFHETILSALQRCSLHLRRA